MINKENKIKKSLKIHLGNVLSRLYISRLDENDRNAIYSEFKEWIETEDIDLSLGNIIYYRSQNRY